MESCTQSSAHQSYDIAASDNIVSQTKMNFSLANVPTDSKLENLSKQSTMFPKHFEDGSLKNFIDQNTIDPWIGTNFEKYVFLSPKAKGEFGERFVQKHMELLQYKVERAPTSTAGHDRLILKVLGKVMTSKYRTEIKFSVACRNKDKKDDVIKDKFIINHVSVGKDWERLIFCGINPNEEDIRFTFIEKKDFETHLQSDNCYFKHQQGGKKIGNDDYICSNVADLLKCDFVKDISKW
jgi:hypothetical protein